MSDNKAPELSIVVPIFNEAESLLDFHKMLVSAAKKSADNSYEIIYCDDGSTDDSQQIIRNLCSHYSKVKLIALSKNFGKENALTAGISASSGQAVIMLDGDGQHPPDLIPEFIEQWRSGARVVIGLRANDHTSWTRRISSKLFYVFFNKLSGQKIRTSSTDYRLIDKDVRSAFLKLHETDRVTRGLMDWLGFKPTYIEFNSPARIQGKPNYSYSKLLKLAVNGFVSLSPVPLYLFGVLGIFITALSFLLGSAILIEQVILDDPWHWRFTGTAMLSILLLFLVGLLLLSQGILSLYVSHISNQVKARPLYVIDYNSSVGIDDSTRI